ncbi:MULTISPECIES: hypothetical protein [Streptomyces]|uniref:Uncharacterized protein n=2 Tax=Streptomyces TaxID=1883 RepID=A0A0W7WXP4_9ACTN|nr:hypothetical protein [Streptomyces silvensis]KUF15330.1 hypothetical protein AT728_29660 [Streptomyces silvensis]MVO89158.1 hypothetical protein [Streptomyces typhae]
MPAAALPSKPATTRSRPTSAARASRASRAARPDHPTLCDVPYVPLEKRPLPPGRPRDWYITHNRRLKAMRLAIALLDSGVLVPNQASNVRIRTMAETVGIHPPSDTTCHMVRALMRYSR